MISVKLLLKCNMKFVKLLLTRNIKSVKFLLTWDMKFVKLLLTSNMKSVKLLRTSPFARNWYFFLRRLTKYIIVISKFGSSRHQISEFVVVRHGLESWILSHYTTAAFPKNRTHELHVQWVSEWVSEWDWLLNVRMLMQWNTHTTLWLAK